ncbi:RNA methyltransferase [Undibacterium cyanobacteriorum]|uniref:RNA methyltransferase n=1 Tax=Undibacterium cyanobacteriorum TaxID=3073561 RepID=A0ABY9RMH7_9BURK|nr:RNA methyltransferase [Undibacterium sp. 20NA77.5]WMW82409.1 RNA methyltransferase [Undibacterium sp. 20NA77.5]
MKQISSRENALYKELKQLASSASARRKSGLSLLDGTHLCTAYLQHRGVPQQCVLAESSLHNQEVHTIVSRLEEQHANVIVLTDALYNAISQVENGVGLCFVVPIPCLQAPDVLNADAVLLDGLQDPGNLGSILRSAAAAGIKQVFCSEGSAAAWSPKVLRAGMGAHFVIDIFEGVDLKSLIASAKVRVLATSSHTETTIYHADLKHPIAWLFGHEGQGVSPELMELATTTVTIPQQPQIESLNVAASAAICFFEQVRQKLL